MCAYDWGGLDPVGLITCKNVWGWGILLRYEDFYGHGTLVELRGQFLRVDTSFGDDFKAASCAYSEGDCTF